MGESGFPSEFLGDIFAEQSGEWKEKHKLSHPLKKVADLPFEGANRDRYLEKAAERKAAVKDHQDALDAHQGSALQALSPLAPSYADKMATRDAPKPRGFEMAQDSKTVSELAEKLYNEDKGQAETVMAAGQFATEMAMSAPLLGAGFQGGKWAVKEVIKGAPTRMGRIAAGPKPPPPPTAPKPESTEGHRWTA